MDGIGNGMNATNTIRATIFSKGAEDRIVAAVEKLADHFTKTPERAPAPKGEPALIEHEIRIQQLEHDLKMANAKLSQRF